MSATTQHGQRLRRRQMHYQLLDRLDSLISVLALWWLLNMRMDALLLFIVGLTLQIMIFQVKLEALLREDGER